MIGRRSGGCRQWPSLPRALTAGRRCRQSGGGYVMTSCLTWLASQAAFLCTPLASSGAMPQRLGHWNWLEKGSSSESIDSFLPGPEDLALFCSHIACNGNPPCGHQIGLPSFSRRLTICIADSMSRLDSESQALFVRSLTSCLGPQEIPFSFCSEVPGSL